MAQSIGNWAEMKDSSFEPRCGPNTEGILVGGGGARALLRYP